MTKKKYPVEVSVLKDQTPLVKALYSEWDHAAITIEKLNKIIKSDSFKNASFKKRFYIYMQRFYMQHYFNCVDKQIIIEVLKK